MADDFPLPPHAAFAAQALVAAAKRPGSVAVAMCTDTSGAAIATLCMVNRDGSLFPFALVPEGDLRTMLTPPAQYLAPQLDRGPRRIGFAVAPPKVEH